MSGLFDPSGRFEASANGCEGSKKYPFAELALPGQ